MDLIDFSKIVVYHCRLEHRFSVW